MAAGGSIRVVVLALVANSGIAAAKLIAGLFTGSGAMLAEAVHSAADAGNQGLLIVGHKRSQRPADETHPLGYGREAYFWAMLVAVLLFFVGGAYSLYEGLHKLQHPEPLKNGWWAVGVLTFSLGLEGYSLHAAWKEMRKHAGDERVMSWARSTPAVNLLVVTFEDLAAMLGLVLALVAVVLAMVTGDPLYDALGTIVIGVLLFVVAIFLAVQIRRLIVGYRADPEIQDRILAVWDDAGFDVLEMIATWNGPESLMVVCKVRCRTEAMEADELIRRVNGAERDIASRFAAIDYLFVEPDFR